MSATLPRPELIRNAAVQYVQAGLSVIQTDLKSKQPVGTWKRYQSERMNPRHIMQQAHTWKAIGLVCGQVSGNLECLDFDHKAAWFPTWRDLVEAEQPGLVDRLTQQKTQNDGLHAPYRCPEVTIPGSMKLAYDRIPVDGPGDH
ncbi:Bifunctional DNA primase/polymerase, N-terminal [Desulfonatronum zhilinae]|nr:Bifunctional DNA primase/polymerase, N-terminal [Desulfonatronum zhilinae]